MAVSVSSVRLTIVVSIRSLTQRRREHTLVAFDRYSRSIRNGHPAGLDVTPRGIGFILLCILITY